MTKNGLFTDVHGNQEWYRNGELHRDDGPAVISANGAQDWYQNGLLHREDGPARIWQTGDLEWWLNGNLHRVNGPAVIKANGDWLWWLDDKAVREQEHPFIKTLIRLDFYTKWKRDELTDEELVLVKLSCQYQY